MAVEIPVVIDIEKAFADAASRVESAIQPLKHAIDKSTGELALELSPTREWSEVRKLGDMIKEVGRDTVEFRNKIDTLKLALDSAVASYNRLYTLQAHGNVLSPTQRNTMAELAETIGYLKSEINLRTTAANTVSEEVDRQLSVSRAISQGNAALETEANTITELNAKITALRGKLENIVPKDGRGRWTKEWKETTAEIQKATNALAQYKVKFDAVTNPGSIDRIRTEIAKLDKQWNAMSRREKFDQDGNLSKSAQKLVDKYKQLVFESEKYGQSLANMAGKAKPVIDSTTKSLQTQSSVLRGLTSYASMYVSAFGLVRFAKQIRDVTGELEYQRVALGHLIQDQEYGNVLFEKIKGLAVESPFRIKNLVTYTKQLAAYRIEEDQLYDTTKRLADISAGLGVDMNRLILAYGQVRAASVLRGQELRQFTEAGIPLVDLLAEKFRELGREGTTTADVFKLISQRAVPFSMISDIFEDLTEKGGMFYKMQEEQARTLKGRWEKLKDAYDIALQGIGETKTFNWLNDSLLSILRKLADNLEVVPKLIRGATYAWLGFAVAIRLFGKRVKDATAAEVLEAAATKASARGAVAGSFAHKQLTKALVAEEQATNRVTAALARLRVAMWTNPWIALASVVLGAAVALFSFRKRSDEAIDSLAENRQAIEDYRDKLSKYGEGGKAERLADTYLELRDKTDLTEKESRKLHNTMSDLVQLYPTLTDKIYENNKALSASPEDFEAEREKLLKESEENLRNRLEATKANRDAIQKQYDEQAREAGNAAALVAKYRAALAEDKNAGELIGDYWVSYSDQLERALENYNKLQSTADETWNNLEHLNDNIATMENLLDPVSTKTEAWKESMKDLNEYALGNNVIGRIFEPQDIDNLEGVADLYKKLKKEWNEAKTEADSLYEVYQKVTEPIRKAKLFQEYNDALARYNQIDRAQKEFGFNFKRSGTGRKSDTRLSDLRKEISETRNAFKKYDELLKYMDKSNAEVEIAKLFPQLKGEVPDFDKTIQWFRNKLEEVQQKLKKAPKDKTLLDMQNLLETEISNLNFEKLKKGIETRLKQLSDEVKHSETARNFFHDMLDLTGDENLATNMTVSVYGGVGDEFKNRVQKEMFGALESVKDLISDKDFFNEMVGNITIFDVNEIRSQLQNLPTAIRPTFEKLLAENEKFNADWVKDIYTTYKKSKTFEERITDIRKREAQKRREIAASEVLTDDEKEKLTKASVSKEDRDVAKVQLEAMKDTYTWTKTFEDLEGVSSRTLKSLIALIEEYIEKYGKDLEPQQLKELTRAKENAKAQQMRRNAYKGAVTAIKEYNKARKLQNAIERYGQKDTEKYNKVLDRTTRALYDLDEALETIQQDMNQVFSITKDLMDVFASDEDASYFSKQLDNISGIFGGVKGTTAGIMGIIANPADINSWKQALQGISDLVVNVAKFIREIKFKKINEEIEQQQKIIDGLEESYGRLEKAIEKSFGSDYIYNYTQQLENLAAKQAAYEEQARLESLKGKKADEEKVKDYEKAARDAADQIADMRSQLSEFFSGTDLESAAQDFADAWIDAYKEFSSTTDAMSEKFNDMIESMINKSLAAKVMQEMLSPIFSQIDELAKDGVLSTEDIAAVAALAQERIPLINDAMTNLMTSLASAGYDVKTTTAGLSGISKGYATASEESILGLAAAVNTQNYYISYVPTISENVAQILSAMTGGASPASQVATNENGDIIPSVQQMVYDHLPSLDQNMAEMLRLMRSVITTKNATTNTAYIAVK